MLFSEVNNKGEVTRRKNEDDDDDDVDVNDDDDDDDDSFRGFSLQLDHLLNDGKNNSRGGREMERPQNPLKTSRSAGNHP